MKSKTAKIITSLLATPVFVVAIAVGNSNATDVTPSVAAQTAPVDTGTQVAASKDGGSGGMGDMQNMNPRQCMEMMQNMDPQQRQQMRQHHWEMMQKMDPQQRDQMMQ